jgi:hypothetical protein
LALSCYRIVEEKGIKGGAMESNCIEHEGTPHIHKVDG